MAREIPNQTNFNYLTIMVHKIQSEERRNDRYTNKETDRRSLSNRVPFKLQDPRNYATSGKLFAFEGQDYGHLFKKKSRAFF